MRAHVDFNYIAVDVYLLAEKSAKERTSNNLHLSRPLAHTDGGNLHLKDIRKISGDCTPNTFVSAVSSH